MWTHHKMQELVNHLHDEYKASKCMYQILSSLLTYLGLILPKHRGAWYKKRKNPYIEVVVTFYTTDKCFIVHFEGPHLLHLPSFTIYYLPLVTGNAPGTRLLHALARWKRLSPLHLLKFISDYVMHWKTLQHCTDSLLLSYFCHRTCWRRPIMSNCWGNRRRCSIAGYMIITNIERTEFITMSMLLMRQV